MLSIFRWLHKLGIYGGKRPVYAAPGGGESNVFVRGWLSCFVGFFELNGFEVFGGEERIKYYIMCLIRIPALYVVLVCKLTDALKSTDQASKCGERPV